MRQLFSKLLITPILFATLFSGSQSAFAASATLNFAPDSTNVTVGQKFHVAVKVDIAGFAAASIRTYVKYDTSALDFTSMSDQSSAFDTSLSMNADTSAGVITMRRGKTGSGVTGNALIADVYFTPKKTGSTTLSFDSGSKIWESSDTGAEQPLNTSNTATFNMSQAASSGSSGSGTKATPKPTAKPKSGTSGTSGGTNPTSGSSGTSSGDATASVSASQSIVTLSSPTALADGQDAITVTVLVKQADGTIVSNITPSLTGLRSTSDTATDFAYDVPTQSWTAHISSKAPGDVVIMISAGGVVLGSKDITFNDTGSSAGIVNGTTNPSGGGSWVRTVLIGLGVLILLLAILFFIWRRLRGRADYDDESYPEEPAYPGDESSYDESGGIPPTNDAGYATEDTAPEQPVPAGLQPLGNNQPFAATQSEPLPQPGYATQPETTAAAAPSAGRTPELQPVPQQAEYVQPAAPAPQELAQQTPTIAQSDDMKPFNPNELLHRQPTLTSEQAEAQEAAEQPGDDSVPL